MSHAWVTEDERPLCTEGLLKHFYFLNPQVKSAGNDTHPLSIPNNCVFIYNGHHQLRTCDLLFFHVESPRINEAKYFIISHIPFRYTCIKSTVALVLQLYHSCHVCLNMNDLVQLEC